MKRSKTAPETIGEQLRKAREKLGLSAAEVAQRTKIHPRVVTALEEDQAVERLSPVYVRSFLRMYARFVGLDEQAMVREFSEQHPEPGASMPPQALPDTAPPLPESAVRPVWRPTTEQLRKAAWALGLVAGVWCLLWVGRGIAHRVQTMQMSHARLAAAPMTRPKRAFALSRATAATALQPMIAIPAQEPLKLQLVAKERVWLRVTADGKVIFQNVLEKGRTETWTANDTIVLWLGNAGGVELTLNGQSLGAPGRRGEVIRDYHITHTGVHATR